MRVVLWSWGIASQNRESTHFPSGRYAHAQMCPFVKHPRTWLTLVLYQISGCFVAYLNTNHVPLLWDPALSLNGRRLSVLASLREDARVSSSWLGMTKPQSV